MNILLKVTLFFYCLHATTPAFGSAEKTLEMFKGLKGKWTIQLEGKPIPVEMTYELGSKNSIVSEQFGKELTVIYLDGNDLLMTHFCNAGNQPRLKLKSGDKKRIFEFEMFDITNLKDPEAAHVQKIIYKIIDGERFDLELIWKKGKTEESERYSLKRI